MITLKPGRKYIKNLSISRKVVIKRYLREAERKINPIVTERLNKAMLDLAVFGTAIHSNP